MAFINAALMMVAPNGRCASAALVIQNKAYTFVLKVASNCLAARGPGFIAFSFDGRLARMLGSKSKEQVVCADPRARAAVVFRGGIARAKSCHETVICTP